MLGIGFFELLLILAILLIAVVIPLAVVLVVVLKVTRKTCRACRRRIPKGASRCPHCQTEQSSD